MAGNFVSLARYQSQRLKVVNTIQIFVQCRILFQSERTSGANWVYDVIMEKLQDSSMKRSFGQITVEEIGSGYKISVRRVIDELMPTYSNNSMAAGTQWQSDVIDRSIEIAMLIANEKKHYSAKIHSLVFIDDAGNYFQYDIKEI